MTAHTTLAPAPPLDRPGRALRRTWINFVVFAVVVIGSGWLFVALDRATGEITGTGSVTSTSGSTSGQGLWILVPALAALALYFLSRDGAGPLGLTLRFAHRTRWAAFCVAVLPAIGLLIILAGMAAGVTSFASAPAPGKPALLVAILSTLPFLLVKNVIEEFIFRGYGTRTAMALGLSGAKPHILVGTVWALWHLPLYLVWMPPADMRAATSLPWLLFLPMFLLGTIALGIVFGEIRVQTGSIWPVVLMHTVINAIATPLLINGHLTFTGHSDALFQPIPNALISMILTAGLGLYLLRRRQRAV